MASMEEIRELEMTAERCRKHVLRMIRAGGHGHLGGAFSAIDIVTALYFYQMAVKPDEPEWEGRDRFILSAGHKCMSQYAVLAERGYFPKEILDTYGALKSRIPGHPDMHKLPGIEANTGALGHGLSIAAGMALALKSDKKNSKVYVMMGDGELAEGSNWEAVAAAAHHKLNNLVLFLDYNGLQISGQVEKIMNMMPAGKKFEAFGWNVKEINGNDMEKITGAMDTIDWDCEKPTMIVCHTVKGKGISFLENQASCHFWTPAGEELNRAEKEIEDRICKIEKKKDLLDKEQEEKV